MPRILNDKPCEVTFDDTISDTKITLSYRLPTTEERIKYTNSTITRKRNRIESTIGETRLKFGAAILIGFKEGAFATDKGILSSDPASPNYDPEWKSIIKKYAQDVITMLAIHVFESPLSVDDAPDDEDEDEDNINP